MRKNIQTAYAKINLSLDILGRLENGYHIVKMVMQTIDLSDELIFETQDRDCPSMEITLASDSGEIPFGEDNLIVKAIRRMEAKYSIRKDLRITLKKRIPVAAGMAGGSTDAAAALRAVRDLFVPEIGDEELQKIGVTLGADIPYCVTGGTQLSEGIGEVLRVLPDAPQCGLVICKPPVGVSTGEVYQRYDQLGEVTHPDIDAQIRAIERTGFQNDGQRPYGICDIPDAGSGRSGGGKADGVEERRGLCDHLVQVRLSYLICRILVLPGFSLSGLMEGSNGTG